MRTFPRECRHGGAVYKPAGARAAREGRAGFGEWARGAAPAEFGSWTRAMAHRHDAAILPRVPPPVVIALFGPTGVGKTAVALALAQRLRERGEDPVAVSADALQVYSGLEILTGAANRQPNARCSSIGSCPFSPSMRASAPASTPSSPTPRSTQLLAEGRRPIVVGGTGLYLRAALTELSLRPPPAEGVREQWVAELELRGPQALHALLAHRAPGRRSRSTPATVSASSAPSSSTTPASSSHRAPTPSCGPTPCATRRCSSA